jgi:hypothetical protein
MAAQGQGALVGWFDCDPQTDLEMNEWLAREHFPERLALPGFRRGRRWQAESQPRYFVLYETDDVATLSSTPYLERLNTPTEWSARLSPGMFGMKRTVCRVTATAGDIDGGCAGTLEFAPAHGAAEPLRDWLARGVLPRLAESPGICAAHLLEADVGTSSIETVEKSLRSAPDALVSWVIVVEGQQPAPIWRQVAQLCPEATFQAHGARDLSQLSVYRLSFSIGSL